MDEMSMALLAVKGDGQATDKFIRDNKRFILSCANRTTKRFVTESDDEYSIALIAFSEAMDSYEKDKGSFPALAATVIKRRLIDYIRSEARHADEMSMEPYVMDADLGEGEEVSALQMEVIHKSAEDAIQIRDMAPGTSAAEDEIAAMQQILTPYGFSLFDLAECSPKSDKTKKACAAAVITMLKSDELLRNMREKKTLPMKELSRRSKVSKKILDRHRRYLIAAVEILNGEYPLMAEYMSYIKESL